MVHFSLLVVLVSLLVLLSSYHNVSSTTIIPKHDNATDRSSLLMFNSAISSNPLTIDQWNDTVHFCEWKGVTCGNRKHPERVVALNLSSLDLVGIISPALANLTFLRIINLSFNNFHGPIPRELERLPRLKILRLDHNSLTEEIPRELSRCSQLRVINFTHNMLGGSIPSELGYLFSLYSLGLRFNNIEGQIPPALGNLSSLVILDLANNSISGNIPPTLGNKLSILTFLDLGLNNLVGAIPTSLWNLSSLEFLELDDNQLRGSLPPDIGQSFTNLLFLTVNNNKMHGHIPTSLSNASNLYHIGLGTNSFGGRIPESLGSMPLVWFDVYGNQLEAKDTNDWSFLNALTNCSQLKLLQLDYNNLGGMLPQSIQNLSTTTLQVLSLGGNHIYGRIPSQIGNLVNLEYLDMGPNLLIGSIPDSVGMISNLHILDFNRNNITGEIPSTLGNLTQLDGLYLDVNSFSGSIPTSLGNCRFLNYLDLGYNKLTGSIPKEVLTISSLSIVLSFAKNLLTGPIPLEIGNLMNLGILILDGNKLSGEIPVTLGKCVVLEYLYLQNNYFEGSIPSSLSSLRGIQELDLSHNNLSGQIPTFLEDFLGLYYLNLSFNNFEGEVPGKGVFANASAISILGNKMLCGGNPKLHLTSCPITQVQKKHHSSKRTMIILIMSAFWCLVLLLFIVATRYCLMKSRKNLAAKNVVKEQHSRISYGQLAKATNGFSEENLIGFGSFGSVYKGKLDYGDDTKLVAVKVFNLQQRGAYKSFMVECDALKNVRHRNLVKIITACSSVDFRGNEFKAMVLELMVNGNLETWLHPEPNDHCESMKLNLMQRLNIAIDVASALDYLHHHGQIPIVHCDLKPSNILLDDEMVAHVGDFGLARFLSESTGNSTSSSGLKGTLGYVAPEYGLTNVVSTHGDVYSYGVLLLELFTGKRPTDDIFKNSLTLCKFVEMAFPEQVMDIIDLQMLIGECGLEDSKDALTDARIIDCVSSVLRVGLLCTKDLARERMEMKVVVNELHAIRKMFLKT